MKKHIIEVDERLPLLPTIPLSLQHLFAMFGSTVLVPFLLNVDPATCLFMNGIGTLIYLTICKWRLPAYLGSSFAFISPVLAVTSTAGMSYADAQGGFIAFGLCLLPGGIAFLLPISAIGRYAILLAVFCVCQLGCTLFSTYAISVIQARTPEHLMGKVMSYVFTLSLCAQPLGQILYGALFDYFSDRAHWVLIPSGLLICAAGLASSGFFARWEQRESA